MIVKAKEFEVTVGEGTVTLRTRGSRHVRTALILGQETDPDGIERLWLDRVMLDPWEFDQLADGWRGTGAVSTVLVRAPAHRA